MRAHETLSDIRNMGFGGWLVYATDRTLGKLLRGKGGFHVLKFYLQPVPAARLVPERPNDPVVVAEIDRTAVAEAAFDRPVGAIPQRFDDGSVCIAALKQGELLGFMWLQHGVLRERIVRCRMHAVPASRVEWDYDFFIEPRYRLGRLFARLWDAAAEHLRDRNVEATLSWVHLANRASAKAHARLGARPIGWAAFLSVLGHQFMISSMRPRIAWSRPGQTVDLYVDATETLDRPV